MTDTLPQREVHTSALTSGSTSFLCIGDPHFHVDNLDEVDEFCTKALRVVTERRPTYVVVMGDVLHTHERLHVVPLNRAYAFLDALRRLAFTYVLVGNHDMVSCSQFLTEAHWMNGLKEWRGLKVVDRVVSLTVPGPQRPDPVAGSEQTFLFVPFVPNGRFEEALQTVPSDFRQATCIFAHQEFRGCRMGALVSENGDRWDPEFPLVISGHIHSPQRPQENVVYTGSALQHAFGESERNILLLATFSPVGGPGPELEELDLGLRRKKIVYTSVTQVSEAEFKLPETKDQLKLSLSGEYADFKAFRKTERYRELVESGVKVVHKPTRAEVSEKKADRNQNLKLGTPSSGDGSASGQAFPEILHHLVCAGRDPYLYALYEELLSGQKTEATQILLV